jgi:hypothetical protein
MTTQTHTYKIYNSEAFNCSSYFYRFRPLARAFEDSNLGRFPALQASLLKLAIIVSQQVLHHKLIRVLQLSGHCHCCYYMEYFKTECPFYPEGNISSNFR